MYRKVSLVILLVVLVVACSSVPSKPYTVSIEVNEGSIEVANTEVVFAGINHNPNDPKHPGTSPDWSNPLAVVEGKARITSDELGIWLHDISWEDHRLSKGDPILVKVYSSQEDYYAGRLAGQTTLEITNFVFKAGK